MEESRGRRRWWQPIVLGIVVLGLSAALGYGLAQLVAQLAAAPAPEVTLPPVTATPITGEGESPSPRRRPSPSPTATDEPTASASQLVHVVEEGEFLSRIAARYGVSIEAIIEANDISNPDLVEVGQRLIIPVRAEPAGGEEASPS